MHGMRRFLTLLVLLTAPVAAPHADSRLDHERARAALAAGEIRPLADLLAEVEKRWIGQVIDTELERDDGRWIYELKLLPPSGRLYELKLDARTGALIRSRGPVQERK
jgi:uncharacterized membrane protein YkoI